MPEIQTNTIVSLQGDAKNFPKSINQFVQEFDAITIKAVTYVDAAKSTDLVYLLRCSETNDYIASFVLMDARASITPDITIILKKPVLSVSFQLYTIGPNSNPVPCTDGILNVICDLVKYKK